MKYEENLSLRLFYESNGDHVQIVVQDRILYLGPLNEEAIQEALRKDVVRRLNRLMREGRS